MKRRLLERRIVRAVVVGAAALGVVVSVAVFLLYTYSFMRDYKHFTGNDVKYALSMLDDDYLEKLFTITKERYYGRPIPPGEDSFSDEYIAYLMENPCLQDTEFWASRRILERCRVETGLTELILCFLDEENERLVFVLDGDDLENAFLPGNWFNSDFGVVLDRKLVDTLRNSDWRMKLDHSAMSGWIMASFENVVTADGEELGVVLVETDATEVVHTELNFLIFFFFVFAVCVYLLARIADLYLRKTLVKPILAISNTARNYTARDKTESEEGTRFFEETPPRTGDEIEQLWESLVVMESDINSTMAKIRMMTSEKERMNAELDMATRIQADQLPKQFPAFPERRDFDIFASMTPARDVGGDFYDFFLTDENHIALVIADVSGKGVPAALFMMMAKLLLKDAIKNGATPAEAMKRTNSHLLENNEEMLFVTMWVATVDLTSGKGLACNAGHENPALRRAGRAYKLQNEPHFSSVAMWEDEPFEDHEFTLFPGDSLFCYTDGVPEANNEKKELFGTHRMLKVLNKDPDVAPEQILKNMKDAIDAYAGEAEQFDDITMLCFRYKGPAPSDQPAEERASD